MELKRSENLSGSLKKAKQILEYVSQNQGEMRQVDIQKYLSMKKTTAHRYFEALEEMNFLEKKNDRYFLGLELLRLGNKVQSRNLILHSLNPILEAIVSEINETVNVAQFNGDSATYIQRVESSRNLQFRVALGDNLPLYCTGLGKAILSLLSDHQVKNLVDEIPFIKFTENTITDKRTLLNQVNEIREKGYAVECEEFEEGLICLSVPLYFETYDFTGAISFSGTTNRIDKETLIEVFDKIKPQILQIKNKFNK
ncbi:MAG: IclR family transcriptional regulator [Rhodothermaceae bacterium]